MANANVKAALDYVTNEINKENKSYLDIPPKVNIISKEAFEKRTQEVFGLICESLARSFGPYGAPTIIYNYPYSHVTKDGYTIMKNLSMDTSRSLLDEAIKNMIEDICGRLNYTVGDGTTSAVVATDSIYQSYLKFREQLKELKVLPRDIIRSFRTIQELIIDELKKYVIQIRSDDSDELYENIKKVVYISSNGDESMTEHIAGLYKELMCPAITAINSPDGTTNARLIKGYRYELMLADKLYINSDNDTMNLDEADILIFSTAVDNDIYENIIQPMNEVCRQRGRKLIVAAIRYDESTIALKIKPDLNAEYEQTHNINLVLTTYKAVNEHCRKLVEDFAVLCNTQVLDRKLCLSILDNVHSGHTIDGMFNTDIRDIPGLRKAYIKPVTDPDTGALKYKGYIAREGIDHIPEGFSLCTPDSASPLLLGYVQDCSLGLKQSVFRKFFYDENKYQVILRDAKDNMEETCKKYAKLGTFNLEVNHAQDRYYSLLLKMGIIEVGFDSELSAGLERDAVDDEIRAANSAFNYGVVKGCNVTLIKAVNDVIDKISALNDIPALLIAKIIKYGFESVYKRVLMNGYSDYVLCTAEDKESADLEDVRMSVNDYLSKTGSFYRAEGELFFKDQYALDIAIDGLLKDGLHTDITFFDVIVAYSVETNSVFDITRNEFSEDVINSFETDKQILVATTDLVSLLITGNQVLVTQRHNFE